MSNQVVLIVDDDESSRVELTAALNEIKLTSDVAASGQEALDKIETSDFSLVLLDITLPGMDGWHVLRQLRHIHPHLPVVLMTAKPPVEDVVDAMRHGAVDFLEKPFGREHVQEPTHKSEPRESKGRAQTYRIQNSPKNRSVPRCCFAANFEFCTSEPNLCVGSRIFVGAVGSLHSYPRKPLASTKRTCVSRHILAGELNAQRDAMQLSADLGLNFSKTAIYSPSCRLDLPKPRSAR
jgi:CheY-like chemotaxis protein